MYQEDIKCTTVAANHNEAATTCQDIASSSPRTRKKKTSQPTKRNSNKRSKASTNESKNCPSLLCSLSFFFKNE